MFVSLIRPCYYFGAVDRVIAAVYGGMDGYVIRYELL